MKKDLVRWLSALLAAVMLLGGAALMEELPAEDVPMAEETPVAEEFAEEADEAPEAESVEEAVAEPFEAEVEETEAALVEEHDPEFEAQVEEELPAEEASEIIEAEADEANKLMAPASNEIPIDAAHFPDDAFRSFVAGYDTDKSGGLSEAERNAVTYMTLSTVTGYDDKRRYYAVNVDAHSLQGIEYFPKLESLNCGGLGLSGLDLSKNTNLNALCVSDCGLSSLTLGSLPNLGGIDCMNNAALAALDISGCPSLTNLRIEGTAIASLDISPCPGIAAGVVPANFQFYYSFVQYVDASGHIYLCCNYNASITGGTPVQIIDVTKNMTVHTTVGACLYLNRPGSGAFILKSAKSSKPKVVSKIKMTVYSSDFWIWTANAKGTSKVTIKDGKKYVVTIKVGDAAAAVTAPPENAITVTKNMKYWVDVGTFHQIYLNGKTGKNFKSSNKKVAYVDQSGNIAAVGGGKSKITFKVGKKKRTLTLIVVDPTIPTAVYLDKTGTVAAKVGETQTITAAVPEGTTTDYTWKSSNKKVATVANGVVTFKKKGKVTITCTTTRGKKKAKVKFVVSK